MKIILIQILTLLLIQTIVRGQSCHPDSIIFTKQSQIDSFQINYPNCTEIEGYVKISGNKITNLKGLEVITYIGGDVIIEENETIANLTGLNNLDSIGGNLKLLHFSHTRNLTGLNNLSYIGGSLSILMNMIENLSGLDKLSSIGGDLYIYEPTLKSLEGLQNLSSIGGDLKLEMCLILNDLTKLVSLTTIGGNLWLEEAGIYKSLTGFNNLKSIGGDIWIEDMNMVNFKGLNNLTSVGGYINIEGMDYLTSLIGLDNIEAGSIDSLYIYRNSVLSICEVQSICDYLVIPNGKIVLYDNAPGCNSVEEIAAACQSSCLPEGIIFTTQNQINNFQKDYPDCTDIEGDVEIVSQDGISITDIRGLNKLTSIKGNLIIKENELLGSLNGLESLTFIGGSFSLTNNSSLANLTGFDNLTSVGNDLLIIQNKNLESLSGLNNLTYIGANLLLNKNTNLADLKDLKYLTFIGGNLSIENNENLKSLTGIDNVDISYIKNLSIHNNSSLSYCEVLSMCNMISFPKGTVDIYNNATGCNNPEEIANSCGVSMSDNIGMLRKESEIKDLKIRQTRILLIGMGVIVVIIGFMALLFIRLNKVRAHHKSVVLEQKLLRLQMNPHFMFNSLSDLQGFIWSKDTITANEYLSSFSKLLRLILENSRQEFVPVEKEISAITHYLKLQSLRYKDKFEYSIDIDEEIEEENMLIPPMLAQPFIENSIEHGLMPKESTGHIEVKFTLKENLINIEVRDDGIGFKRSSELKKSKHPGQESLAMKITQERLTMIYKKYKQKIKFNISDIMDENNNVAGTRVSFAVPFSRI